MHTSAEFAREIRARYKIESDYALAKLLRVTRQTMSAHKHGDAKTFGEETGTRIAELLGLDEGYVLACLAAERARSETARAAWTRLAARARVAAFALVAMGVTLIGIATPPPAAAAAHVTAPTAGQCILC